jgi:phosphohistidine phosphatase
MPFLPPPPSRIFLMRHAQSGWALPGQTDFDRTLDEAGAVEAVAVSERAAAAGYRPDLVLSSTARRCRETAEAFLRAFQDAPDILYSDELYNAPPAAYFDLVSRYADRGTVMLIGHNPAMEEILETLVGLRASAEALPDGYPTAGFAVLTHPGEAAAEEWVLSAFLKR